MTLRNDEPDEWKPDTFSTFLSREVFEQRLNGSINDRQYRMPKWYRDMKEAKHHHRQKLVHLSLFHKEVRYDTEL